MRPSRRISLLLIALALAAGVKLLVTYLPSADTSTAATNLASTSPWLPTSLPPDTDRWSTPPVIYSDPRLTHETFHSKSMNLEVGFNIYLPPNYQADKTQKYPVLYWLHGLDQSESTNQYPIQYLDQAIKAKTIKPMIVIYASGGQRTYYTDNSAINSLSETAVIKELIPHIDATYRTNATRDQRAIAGMSMGGFGALKLAFKYPDLFSSVTAFAPGIRDPLSFKKERPDILKRMFDNDPANYEANHPATLVQQNKEKIKHQLPISIYVGTTDYLLAGARAMDQTLTELKIDHVYQEFPDINHNLVKLSEKTKETPFAFAAKNFK